MFLSLEGTLSQELSYRFHGEKGQNMIFLYQRPIYNAVKKTFDIDLTLSEYSGTVFSVNSIETVEPFEFIYKGDITIRRNNKEIYYLHYTINSHEDIPEQSECILEIDEYWTDNFKIKSPNP